MYGTKSVGGKKIAAFFITLAIFFAVISIAFVSTKKETEYATAVAGRTNNLVSGDIEILSELRDYVRPTHVFDESTGELDTQYGEASSSPYLSDIDGTKYYYTGIDFSRDYSTENQKFDYIDKRTETRYIKNNDTVSQEGTLYYKFTPAKVTASTFASGEYYIYNGGNKYYYEATQYDSSVEMYYTKDIAVEETTTPEGLATLYKENTVSNIDTEKFYQISTYENSIVRKYGPIMLANVSSESDFSNSNFMIVNETGAETNKGIFVLLENPNQVEFIITFSFGESLKHLLKDKTLTVTATPYIRSSSYTMLGDSFRDKFVGSKPKVNISLDYYNGSTQKIITGRNAFKSISNTATIIEGESTPIASGTYNEKSLMQIRLSNWQGSGKSFGAIMAEIGIRITVTPNETVQINDEESKFEIVSWSDSGADYRNEEAEWNVAKINDTIKMNLVLSANAGDLQLDTQSFRGVDEVLSMDQIKDGTMFRYVFFDSDKQGQDGEDEYIITWDIEAGDAEIVVDENNKSGQNISFTVTGSDFLFPDSNTDNRKGIRLIANMAYRKMNTQKASYSRKAFIIIVDTLDPGSPTLTNNDFYTKYISNKTFYTSSLAQSKYNAENTIPIQLNIGSARESLQTKPNFTDSAFDLKGGSSQIIYYRTRYYGEEIPTTPSEKRVTEANALKLDDEAGDYEEIGKYCTITDLGNGRVGKTFSDELFINLADKNGENAKSNGVWSIEFVTYDYVGHRAINSIKYFIRVDITDYKLTTRYFLGDRLGGIGASQVLIRYSVLSDQGKLSSWKMGTEMMQLRRGDKVKVEVKFNSSSYYNRYVFTRFYTEGVDMDCIKSCTFDGNTTFLENMWENYVNSKGQTEKVYYTFNVSEAFCKDEQTRFLTFVFKNKVSLRVTGREQIYSGAGKNVISQAVNSSGEVIGGVKVETRYYTDVQRQVPVSVGTHNSNIPVDAGTYYFYSEITNNILYYGSASGTFVIRQATPNISSVWPSLSMDYGESMSVIDFDYSLPKYTEENDIINVMQKQKENENILLLYNDRYVSNISTDGVPGYFAVNVTNREEETYTRPKAGTQQIEIKFVAVKAEVVENGDEFVVTYFYDEYGAFIRDNNYSVAVKRITLNVKHETAVNFMLADNVSVDELGYVQDTYSGAEKTFGYTIKGGRADEPDKDLKQYAIVTYAEVPEEEIAYKAYLNAADDEKEYYKSQLLPTIIGYVGEDEEALALKNNAISGLKFRDIKPSSAGFYVMRVRLNEAACNYSTTIYICIRINKIELDVIVEDTVCEYQYESRPVAVAQSNKKTISVQFNYTYYFYDLSYGVNIASMAVNRNKVPVDSTYIRLATGLPVLAGEYVVKVEINDVNYSGSGYGLYSISKVNNENGHLNVLWPNIATSAVDPSVNILYGQPLKDISIGTNYSVKYTYVTYITSTRTTTTAKNVDGYMMIVTEYYTTWYAKMLAEARAKAESENIPFDELSVDLSKEAYLEYMNNYAEADYSRDEYNWYLCYVTTSEDSANYDFIYQPINIYVGIAAIDWTMTKIDNIVYGKEIADIGDLTISEKLGRLYSTKGIVPEGISPNKYYVTDEGYVYLYIEDKYVFSLMLNDPVVFNAGNTNISVKAEFFGVNKGNYPENSVNSCSLTILKKDIDVRFVYDNDKNAYYKEYNVLDDSDLLYVNGKPSSANKNIYSDGLRIKYSLNGTVESLPIGDFSGEFKFTDINTDKEYVSTSGLPAGEYRAKYTLLNNNYSGSVEFNLVVEKASLRVERGNYPTIADEENTVYFENNVSNVVFTGGNVVSVYGGESVPGEFTVLVNESERFGAAGDIADIQFLFTPYDTGNYNTLRGSVTRIIRRANISKYMRFAQVEDYEYMDVSYYNNATVEQISDLKSKFSYEVTGEYAEQCGNLKWDIILTTLKGEIPGDGYLSAGKYYVTAKLNETEGNSNYMGQIRIELTISKRKAYITLNEPTNEMTYNDMLGVKKAYSNMAQSVSANAYDVKTGNLIESGVSITFKKNDIVMPINPIDIGYYDCYITVASNDYTLVDATNKIVPISSLHTFLMISVNVNEIEIMNLNQIYTVQKPVNVSLGYNNAKCGVYYANRAIPSQTYDELPVNAGTYDVFLTFASIENNGYEETIKISDYKPTVYLTIDKYVAEIVVNKTITASYTGKEADKISAYTVPNNLKLSYFYKKSGTEKWYSVNPVNNDDDPTNDNYNDDADYKKRLGKMDAGEYDVKISIVNNNYKGETTIKYLMQKANLSVATAPVFSAYSYNTDKLPEVLDIENTGVVNCPTAGQTNIEGSFSLDLNKIKTLNAGTHNVTFTFTPTSDNYKPISGDCELVVTKQVLPDDFFTVEQLVYGNHAVEYDRTKHSLNVSYDSSKIYDKSNSNSDFTVRITYNGGSAPIAIGYYEIKVEVTSKNYTYSRIWDENHRLIIAKGMPHIGVLPYVEGKYVLGDTVTSVVGGQAVVKATGNTVDGDFSVINASPFTKANINKVRVRFTPIDTDNFYSNDFDIDVNVIGTDSLSMNGNVLPGGNTINNTDWTDEELPNKATSKILYPEFVPLDQNIVVSGAYEDGHGVRIGIKVASNQKKYYGATLAEFEPEFVCEHNDCDECKSILNALNKCGVLSFAEGNNYVPNVGEKIAVVYKLNYGSVEGYARYNNMCGLISLDGILSKAEVSPISANFELFAFDDGTYMLNAYEKGTNYHYAGVMFKLEEETVPMNSFGNVQQSGMRVSILGVDGAILYTDNVNDVVINIDLSSEEGRAKISVSTLNYNINATNVEVEGYEYIESSEIEVGNTSKAYNGKIISVEELDIKVINTQLAVNSDSCTIKIMDENGKSAEGREIGVYKVKIYVTDKVNKYYGTKEIEFTISKNDISNTPSTTYVKLKKDTDVYASATSSIIEAEIDLDLDGIFEDVDSLAEVKYLYKGVNEPDSAYNSVNNIGFLDVGEYDIKITIETEAYRGVSICRYRIEPRSVTMSSVNCIYNYDPRWDNGMGILPNPRVDAGISFVYTGSTETFMPGFGYNLYYYSEVYAKSESMPLNAGEYNVIVEFENKNYRIVGNTFKYVINKKKIDKVEVPPIMVEGSRGHLTYGQTLGELRILNSDIIVRSSDIVIPGEFRVRNVDKNVIPNAGEFDVTLVFVPINTNYAEYEYVTRIEVGKAQATVTFTTVSSGYNGTSRKNDIKYNVNEDIDIGIAFMNVANPLQEVDPINAGTYLISVTSLNDNYEAVISLTSEGKLPVFTVNKAKWRRVEMPTAVSVSVGVSLAKSSLYNGAVYYEGFSEPVGGTFEFMQSAMVYKTAGLHYADYRFTPYESSNFAIYTGTQEEGTAIPIMIEKAYIEIKSGDNFIEYGTPAYFGLFSEQEGRGLVFETYPAGLENKIVITPEYEGKTYRPGEIMPSGTYYFTCRIEDENYTSEITEFKYTVNKKEITIDFTNDSGSVVTTYATTYGTIPYVGVKVYGANTMNPEISTHLDKDKDGMLKNIVYHYKSRGSTVAYEGFVPPKEIGNYDLTVTLYHDNYTATRTALYTINKGKVHDISFDTDMLVGQQYGSVTAPIVTTTPADVGYYIVYQGFNNTMPQDVGSYNITVYIDDKNYEAKQISAVFRINPKPLSITDIRVYDKAYDGVSTMAIEGQLSGVLYNDEVKLEMKATTFDNNPNVGEHYVTITECKITGLHAENYTPIVPKYDGKVKIYANVVSDNKTGSYIMNSNGFKDGTEITFSEVDTSKNNTSVWSKLIGKEATVVSYAVTVNNAQVINDGQYKICILVPEQYRNSDFNVGFEGDLKGANITYKTEGDYISFYSDTAHGEVVFSKAEFKYEYVVIASILLIILIGIVILFVLNPLQSRRKVSSPEEEKKAIREIKSERRRR